MLMRPLDTRIASSIACPQAISWVTRMMFTRSRRPAITPASGATDNHRREESGHRHDAEPGAGMGKRPGQPAAGHALQPGSGELDCIAADIDAVVAVGQRADDIPQPAASRTQTFKCQFVMRLLRP